jgi:hypothetical protein
VSGARNGVVEIVSLWYHVTVAQKEKKILPDAMVHTFVKFAAKKRNALTARMYSVSAAKILATA